MAIDIQSLFNPGSLQDIAETDEQRRKRAQLTGTMNLGGQTGTFTGNFDPSMLQQNNNTAAPVGYQLPPNYGMQAPPEQQMLPAPAAVPPVGTSPMSGEYTAPPQPPVALPTSNQPYQIPPAVTGFDQSMGQMKQPDIYGGLTPGQALGGEFTMQQPITGFDQSMAQQYQQYADAVFGGSTSGQAYQPVFTTEQPITQQSIADASTPLADQSDQSMAQQYQQYADAVFGGSTPGQGYQPEFTMQQPVGPVAPDEQPSWVNKTTAMANPFSQIPIGEEYNTILGPMPSFKMMGR